MTRPTQEAPRPLSDLVHPGWLPILDPVAERIAAMGDFLRAELAAGRGYLPAGANVLRAFTRDPAEISVLLIGQDPYPTPGCRSRSPPTYAHCRAVWSTSSASTALISTSPLLPPGI